MSLKKAPTILALLTATYFLTNCTLPELTENTNAPVNAASSVNRERAANDKAEELSLLVNLAAEPQEVVFREEMIDQGQEKKRLLAVMRFSDAERAKVIEPVDRSNPVAVELDAERWFPQELIAQSEIEGSKLRGRQLPAAALLLPPYTNGRLIEVENSDYLILEAFTK